MNETISNVEKLIYLDSYQNSLKLWPVDYNAYFVETSHGKTHLIESGQKDAPPLVLLHGAQMSSTMWYANILAWSKHYRVFAIDILGDKNKSIPEKSFTDRASYAKWLEEVLDQLGIEQADLVSLSYGALHTVNFLQFAPKRVNRAVVMSPAETFVHFDKAFYAYAFGMVKNPEGVEAFLDWIFQDRNQVHPFIKEQLVAGMMWVDSERNSAPQKNGFPYVFTDEELSSIQTPILLLLGDKEVMYDPKVALERARKFLPHLQSEMVQGVGHLMSLENPDYINARVLDFLMDEK